MLSILGFLIMLAPLVIVHELGHFLFAKLFNVKAEAFSIGFGPRIFKKQIGETEWRVSAIPLGGYVKLLGEDPEQALAPEDVSRSLQKQAPWKRFFIFFGGPLFNFLWAILVYAAILLIGEPQLLSHVGRVVPNTAAEKAGFVSGDKILAVDQKPVIKYEEVLHAIDAKPDQLVKFSVERKDIGTNKTQTLEISAKATKKQGFSVYGEETHLGEIEGLVPNARSAQIGISNPASAAGALGIKTGDLVTRMNGIEIKSWEQVEAVYKKISPKTQFTVTIQKKSDSKKPVDVTFTKPTQSISTGADLGLFSSEMFIDSTLDSSPARNAGIKPGDRISKIGGKSIDNFFALREAVQKAGESTGKVDVLWEREGKTLTAQIEPTATTNRDALLKKSTQFTIGIVPMLAWAEAQTMVERITNPFVLITKGTERMLTFTYRNFVSIKKMFTGDVSMATLGGPILIGKIAGESLSRGLIAFLTTMAVLSIGLGVLNILPVPVLDGGHILLLVIEVVRGKPLSMKQLEVVQTMGLSLIALLMFVVIKNDLTRLPFFN